MGTTPKNKAIDAEYLLKQFKALNTKVFEKTYSKIKNAIFTGSFSHNRKDNTTIGLNSVTMGIHSEASGENSIAIGDNNISSNKVSVAIGYQNTSSGEASFAEGGNNTASGKFSHAEGNNTTASGDGSHTEGSKNIASGFCSHAEGQNCEASKTYAHAEGNGSIASGGGSHAEGQKTVASGAMSHAGGNYSSAEARASFSHGTFTKVTQLSGAAFGYGNNPQADSIFEIGNGLNADGNPNNTGSVEPVTRQNAFRVTQQGIAIAQTDVQTEEGISLKEINTEIKQLKNSLGSVSLVDDTTGTKYTLGINNGVLYIKEVTG